MFLVTFRTFRRELISELTRLQALLQSQSSELWMKLVAVSDALAVLRDRQTTGGGRDVRSSPGTGQVLGSPAPRGSQRTAAEELFVNGESLCDPRKASSQAVLAPQYPVRRPVAEAARGRRAL